MYIYDLNFYQKKNLVVQCFMQCDADNAKQAMRIFKARIKSRKDTIKELLDFMEDYPGLKMKAEKSIYN